MTHSAVTIISLTDMSFNGTKTPLKPTGVAKWQVPKRKTENGIMAYYLEGELTELFIKNFPIHSNRRIMQWFGISHSTTQRLARQLGLKKDMTRIHKEQARDTKRICEKNGYYDSIRGKGMPEYALIGLRKLREEGFSSIRRLKEKSPRKYKKYIEKKSEARKELWRKERMREKYGLERKTKLNIPFYPMTHRQSSQKSLMIKKYNYFADPDDPHNVCYDSQTRRSERSERTAIRHGLRIVEGGEEQ